MTDDDRATIWLIWNLTADDYPSPVKAIARLTGLDPLEVAAVVYPPGHGFGTWDPDDEPDIEPPVPDARSYRAGWPR